MKNTIKLLGFLIFAAATVFGFTACGEEENPFIGTWKNTSEGITLVCTDTTWSWSVIGDDDVFTGSYTRDGNDASFKVSGVGVGTATVDGSKMTGTVQGYGKFTVTKQ